MMGDKTDGTVRALSVVGSVAGAITAFVLISVPECAIAQTFEEALKQAYESNPQLLAARARLRATDETVAQALSGWRPTVTLNGSYGWQRDKTDTTSTPPSTLDGKITESDLTGSANLQVDQSIYSGGSTVAATRGAENTVKSEMARLHATEQSVLFAAVTAYMDVVRGSATVDLNENNIRVLTRQLEATQDRFRVGEVTRTDVAQAESRLSRGQADLITAKGTLTQSRATFAAVVGTQPGKLNPVKPPPDISKTEQDAVDRAQKDNPNVLAARYTQAAALSLVREIEGQLYPSLSLRGSVGYSDTSSTFDGDTFLTDRDRSTFSSSVTARVTIPLYTAGGVAARVRQAKQTAGQRTEEAGQAQRQAMEDASQAWENLQSARARIRALSSEIRAAEIALEGVRQEALVGSRTVLDVLDAEQELFVARVNLVTALRDEVVAAYQLRVATGDMTAAKLNLAVKVYDPEKYLRENRGRWWGTDISTD